MRVIQIDAHQHFWKLSRGDYGWLTPDSGEIYRDFLPEDLLPLLRENHMDYTVVVQAAPTVAETDFLLSLYDYYDFIAGVVGWLDLESPDFKASFDRFRCHKGFVGVRPMIQDIEDDRWILRPQVLKNIEVMVEEDFPLDLLVLPRHLEYIIDLLKKFPSLKAVINHAAKPNIKEQVFRPWKEQMKEIAAFDNVMCKLSGLITEADFTKWTPKQLQPYVYHIVKVFGTDRVMFGSDWPVCLQAGSYRDVLHAIHSILKQKLTEKEMEQAFGGNAARFYKFEVN